MQAPDIKNVGCIMPEVRKSRYTEAQNKATQKYIRENLEEIRFRVRKGEKDKYVVAAEKAGLSMAKYFLAAADEKIERDSSGGPQQAAGAPAVAGGISLPPDALESAQQAAERTGEAVAAFLARAAQAQAKRDELSLRMGINPAEQRMGE